jgi:hypothetical protein
MIDVTTKKPLRVLSHGTIYPYIRVPTGQLDELRQLLDQHGIRYEVLDFYISLDGGPERAIVHLRRGTDEAAVQTILDNAC